MNKPPEMANVPPNWQIYFRVPDVDAAAERIKAQGGKILNGPMDVPDGDRIVNAMDPQGAAFGLHSKKKPRSSFQRGIARRLEGHRADIPLPSSRERQDLRRRRGVGQRQLTRTAVVVRGPAVGEAHVARATKVPDDAVRCSVVERLCTSRALPSPKSKVTDCTGTLPGFWLTVTEKVTMAPTVTGEVAVRVTSGAEAWTTTTVDPVLRPPLVSSTVAVTVKVPPLR